MTADLPALSDWPAAEGCTRAAIESTGVYWKPVFNPLEGTLEVAPVNARHARAVLGRKTGVRDREWLADLLRHGPLRPSPIPPLEIRHPGELTRYRQTLVKGRPALAGRVQKRAPVAAGHSILVAAYRMMKRRAMRSWEATTSTGRARGISGGV